MLTTLGQIMNGQTPPCLETVALESDGSGDGTAVLGPFTGFLDSLFLDKGTLADTADVSITVARTGEAVAGRANLTADVVIRPRVTPHGITGVALSALTILEPVYLYNDYLNVVLDEAGDTKVGAISALIR
jgi:hypothetical protein